MNRRSLIKSLAGLIAAVGLAPRPMRAAECSANSAADHECGPYCFDSAESMARANINETGGWKLSLHNWNRRTMVVTRCGEAACEVRRTRESWEYHRRSLTPEEKTSFHVEYGRVHWMLLAFSRSDARCIRGFILNGRHDGWNISTGPLA